MKIEKFNIQYGAEAEICKKINEIIDKLERVWRLYDCQKETLSDQQKYLNYNLEKINELQKTYRDQELTDSHLIERLTELDNRISDLEQCPVNDIRQCQSLKPKYDPDDVKFNKSEQVHQRLETLENNYMMKDYQEKIIESILPLYCKPGTFEWALIQMKNGKKVKREKQAHRIYLSTSKTKFLGKLGDSSDESFEWNFSISDILSADWEIVE